MNVRYPSSLVALDDLTFVQREELQPFGHTHKDRRSAWLLDQARREGTERLALITAGNAGRSLALRARSTGIAVTSIIDRSAPNGLRLALLSAGSDIRPADLSIPLGSDAVVSLARTSAQERVRDVTNGAEEAYIGLWNEIRDVQPDSVICPVGSGELFMGLAMGIQADKAAARVWGVRAQAPDSIADKLRAVWTPNHDRIQILLGRGHHLVSLPEEYVLHAASLIPAGIEAEPSASVVYAVLHHYRSELGKTVVINTGDGRK
jgi:threonine synthase